jgi:hypothetical protein
MPPTPRGRRTAAARRGGRAIFGFMITHGKITAIDIFFDAAHLRQLDLVILGD